MTGSDSKYIFSKIARLKEQNTPFILCTIVAKRGSSPRDPGTHMIVTENELFGTVGGGEAEFKAISHARNMLAGHSKEILYVDYDLGMNIVDAEKTGMLCTGMITVMFAGDHMFSERFTEPFMHEYTGNIYAVFDTADTEDGYRIYSENAIPDKIRGMSGSFHFDKGIIVEPIGSGPRVFIFGAGHVGCAVAETMRFLDYEVIVADNRPEVLQGKICEIASNTVLVEWDHLCDYLDLRPSDYAVIMTNEHVNDVHALKYSLENQAYYIGCMGSRARVAANRKMIIGMGFSAEDAERVHTPIGLPIGGRSPQEIAISVAAEIIKTRYLAEK